MIMKPAPRHIGFMAIALIILATRSQIIAIPVYSLSNRFSLGDAATKPPAACQRSPDGGRIRWQREKNRIVFSLSATQANRLLIIVNIGGETIRSLRVPSSARLVWDGRDTRGNIAPRGCYLAILNGVPACVIMFY
jgi:hypothetical protein